MILLLKKKILFRRNLFLISIKYYRKNKIYIYGKFGLLKINLNFSNFLSFFYLKYKLFLIWFELNSGWITVLYLNGLGFKSTKKTNFLNKIYWRFNVGHSHVFQYFTPRNIIFKSKKRFICFFGYKNNQVLDITNKIKTFHLPDCYKGVGIKYPKEIIRLKIGKMR